jgi:hypothetical protein
MGNKPTNITIDYRGHHLVPSPTKTAEISMSSAPKKLCKSPKSLDFTAMPMVRRADCAILGQPKFPRDGENRDG